MTNDKPFVFVANKQNAADSIELDQFNFSGSKSV